MAKLKRVTNKIFGSTASIVGEPDTGAEIGQFGSAKLGTYNATADVEEIQSLSAWNKGWIDAVIPSQQYPTLPEMTGVNKVITYQLGYLHQEGISEWDSNTEYCINSIVKYTPTQIIQNVSVSIGESTGITDVTVNAETFLSQINEDGNYTFTYNGSSWLYNNIVTDITLYGLTITGTPVANDTILAEVITTINREDMKLYRSTIDENINNTPSENSLEWVIYTMGGGGSDLPPQEDGFLNSTNGVLSWKQIEKSYVYPYSSFYGNYDNSTGYPDLISYSGSTASFKVTDMAGTYIPYRVCFTDGTLKEFTSIDDLNVSQLANGTYNLYIDKSGVIHPLKNTEYVSRIVPTAPTSTTIVYYDVYQKSGNLTQYGSPSITSGGLASGFSKGSGSSVAGNVQGNYFKFDASSMSQTNWEFQIKFKASDVTTRQPLTGFRDYSGANGYIAYGVMFKVESGKLTVYIGRGTANNGNGMEITNGGFSISTNTWYTVKVSYNGSSYTTTCNSSSYTYNSSYKVAWTIHECLGGRIERSGTTYSLTPATYCTIDLMNTYVKSSGSYIIYNITKQSQIITTGGNLNVDDIWLDTSVKDYVLRKYNGTSFDIVDYVRLPQQITVSGGAITGINNVLPYNANGWDEQLSTPDYQRKTTLTKGSTFTASLSGYIYNETTNTIFYIDKGYSYTPASGSSGTWYFSPIKGV